MRKSVRKCLSLLAIVTLACSSNEIVDPGVVITTDPNTPGSVLITPPASPDLFVGQSISLVAAVKNTAGLVITVPARLGMLLLSSLSAYALAHFRFRGACTWPARCCPTRCSCCRSFD